MLCTGESKPTATGVDCLELEELFESCKLTLVELSLIL